MPSDKPRFEVVLKGARASDEDLIADMHRVARLIGGESFSEVAYRKHGRYSHETIRKRFKSWNSALQRAHLPILHRHNIPDTELLENIEEVWIRLGRQPSRDDLRSGLTQFGASTYEQRFGSWNKALTAFSSWVNETEVADAASTSASKRAAQRNPRGINLRLRFLVMKRDRFSCQGCGRNPAATPGTVLHVDHIVPWSKGGLTTEDNLQTLCSICNLGKGDAI